MIPQDASNGCLPMSHFEALVQTTLGGLSSRVQLATRQLAIGLPSLIRVQLKSDR